MLVTVFGGGGFIGRHIVQRLAAAGHNIRIAGRDTERAARLCTMGGVGQITPVSASVTHEASCVRAIAGADLVINLVGILFESRAGDFQRIQAEGAGRVARLAAAAGAKQFLHLSAIGADAGSPSLYAQTKAAGEAAVLAAFPSAIILRPSVVFGPDDQFFNRFAGLAAMLPFMPVVAGETRFQPVYVGDVADAAMAALADPAATGKTFELGGPRVMTMREVLRFILDTTGRRRPMLDMPMGLMRFQAGLLQRLPKPPLTQDQLLLLGRDNVVGHGVPSFADLGIAPKSVEAVVPAYLKRFRQGGGRRDAS